MLNVKDLKAEIVRNGYTQATLAEALGMTSRTFSRRLSEKNFGSKEIEIMIELLHLKDPMSIFFGK